jgi:hypothetical protein
VLKPLFGIAFTNDVIVELRPLMYKASTNKQNVHLVEFSPIRIKVKPNGNIEKVK